MGALFDIEPLGRGAIDITPKERKRSPAAAVQRPVADHPADPQATHLEIHRKMAYRSGIDCCTDVQ